MAENQSSNHTAPRILISLVIPVRNETESLGALVESLRGQTRAPAEIIIVDGGSDDGTPALVRRLTHGDARFRLIEVGSPATPGKNRNLGLAAAAHEWVALTDAGIRLAPTWLEELARVVEKDPALDVVYGNYEPLINTWFERCAALAYVPPKISRPGGMMRGPSTASMMVRQSVWRAAGGFPDLRAAEDLIFMERVERQGFRIGYAPAAVVWWSLQPNSRRTFRKFALYSKHNVWAGRQHDWHYGIARQYALWAAFVGLATFTHNFLWLLAIPLGFLLRAAKGVWARREGRGLWWALNPAQLLSVGAILVTIDAATFVGWARALRERPSRRPAGEETVISGP